MTHMEGTPQLYNTLMAHYRYGYALYHPESSLFLRPGICGYIDGEGQWHTMVDILAIVDDIPEGTTGTTGSQDPEITSKKPQYTALDKTETFEREKPILRGPFFTDTVKSVNRKADASTTLPPGIPAEASAIAEFTLNSDFGALLICKGTVTKNFFNGLDPFRNWAKANFGKLLEKFPIIRTYGFYVVTSTWKAKQVFVKSWQDKGHELNVGFSGGVNSIAEISASTEIYGASREFGWNIPIWNGLEEESVIFFGGLQYEYRTWFGWMRQNEDKFTERLPGAFRGEDTMLPDPENEDNAVEICEIQLDDQGKF